MVTNVLPHKMFFRPDEVASVLALSRRTIYRMIRDGRLAAVKAGAGPWRIPISSLTPLFLPAGQADPAP
jgi:excisionase family DNA binding protein